MHPQLLDNIRNDLKDIIAGARYDEVFRDLREKYLLSTCRLYNDTVLIESRYNNVKRADHLGTIGFQEKDLSFNSVTEALLWLVARIGPDDLKEEWKKDHVAIPEYHAFTCDRVNQSDQFDLTLLDKPDEKIHHFYLYGDARQAHESLYERLGRAWAGHLLNWEEGDYEPGTKIVFKSLKPSVHRHPLLYKREVVRTLFAKFFPKINEKEPLDTKTVADLLQSPDLGELGPGDLVFILLTMDDANWNKDVTPKAVESFVTSFLNAELHESAPRFFFFFGLEYEKQNSAKQAEVRQAILNRTFGGEALEELQPVGAGDITAWFSQYRKIMVAPGKEPKEMTAAAFGSAETLDMIEVEFILRQLIQRHNKGLAIQAENLKRS